LCPKRFLLVAAAQRQTDAAEGIQAAKYALKHLHLLKRHVDGLKQCG
jgi:hypothetical protein